jgi:polyribonucleotide nucleotidyltransferase
VCFFHGVCIAWYVHYILKLYVALQMSSVLQAAVNDILSEMEKAPAERRDELKRKMRKIVGDDRLQAMGIRLDSVNEGKEVEKSARKETHADMPSEQNGKVCNCFEASARANKLIYCLQTDSWQSICVCLYDGIRITVCADWEVQLHYTKALHTDCCHEWPR